MDLFDLMYLLSKVPGWIGPTLIGAGACALSFLAGAGLR